LIAPDSSVVIAALAQWHIAHEAARSALTARERRLVGHVAYETTSALSRMPEGRRIEPQLILGALEHDFPEPWLSLDGAGLRAALRRAVSAGVRGGALYDALIAATAAEHGARILSADVRAQATYEALGVQVTALEAHG
jgi:predicted nucleic acid-binding protein